MRSRAAKPSALLEDPPVQLGRLGPRPELPVEDLGLTVRTRNALRSLGCATVGDVIRLDLSRPVRGLGPKTKDELLTKLDRAGFHHPMLDREPATDVRLLERSLERIEGRLNAALASVAREIGLVKQRLRKKVGARTAVAPAMEDGEGRK